ncbi:MAG: LacI family DNA-binding transcriptional regulator [Verrucomicrobiota bacterium]
MPRRPTQLDIALKAGLSRPTVSLALNGSPAVSDETRARVRQVAEELGYQPDPMLSALSKYRNLQGRPNYKETLAWISHSPAAFPWRHITTYAAYHAGACARANALGFDVELIDVQQQQLGRRRLDGILAARGIRGLLICPPVQQGEVYEFPVDRYSLITFGYSVRTPALHRVSSSHFLATKTIFNRLIECGYRRIGFAGHVQVNIKTQDLCLSAYLGGCVNHGIEPLPELLADAYTPEDFAVRFRQWHERHRPDAVIITSPIWPAVQRSGIRIPGELGVASPMVSAMHPELTGIIEKSEQIGATAVDTLVQLIQHDERGVPRDPRTILLEGQWNEGATILGTASRPKVRAAGGSAVRAI